MEVEKRVCESTVRRALAVQEIYLEHQERELPNIYIFRQYIRPVYHISERTFYRYLGMNAKRLVKQFEE